MGPLNTLEIVTNHTSLLIYLISTIIVAVCFLIVLHEVIFFLFKTKILTSKIFLMFLAVVSSVCIILLNTMVSLGGHKPMLTATIAMLLLAVFSIAVVPFTKKAVVQKITKLVWHDAGMPSCVCESILLSNTLKVIYYRRNKAGEFVLQDMSNAMAAFLNSLGLPTHSGVVGFGAPLLTTDDVRGTLIKNMLVAFGRGSNVVEDIKLPSNTTVTISVEAVRSPDNELIGCVLFVIAVAVDGVPVQEKVVVKEHTGLPDDSLDLDFDELLSHAIAIDNEIRNNEKYLGFLQSVIETIPDTAMFVVTEQQGELVVRACGGGLLRDVGWSTDDIVGRPLKDTLVDRPVLQELIPLYQNAMRGKGGTLLHKSSTTNSNHLIRVEPFQYHDKQYALGVSTLVP